MVIEIKIDDEALTKILKSAFLKKNIKWIVLVLLFAFIGTLTADTVTKPNDFTADTIISASQINDNFDTLYDLINGNLDSSNIDSIDASEVATGILDSARIPDLDGNKITTGTIDTERLPVGMTSADVSPGDHSHFIDMAESTTDITIGSSWTDVPDLSITFTLDEETPISFETNGVVSGLNYKANIRFVIDGTEYGHTQYGEYRFGIIGVSGTDFCFPFYYKKILTLAGGSHTVKLQAKCDNATCKWEGATYECFRSRLFVEEL